MRLLSIGFALSLGVLGTLGIFDTMGRERPPSNTKVLVPHGHQGPGLQTFYVPPGTALYRAHVLTGANSAHTDAELAVARIDAIDWSGGLFKPSEEIYRESWGHASAKFLGWTDQPFGFGGFVRFHLPMPNMTVMVEVRDLPRERP